MYGKEMISYNIDLSVDTSLEFCYGSKYYSSP